MESVTVSKSQLNHQSILPKKKTSSLNPDGSTRLDSINPCFLNPVGATNHLNGPAAQKPQIVILTVLSSRFSPSLASVAHHLHLACVKVGERGEMSSYLLPTLSRKREVDGIIRDTVDKVLVLRFGRCSDAACLQLDDIVCPLQFIF